MKISVEAKVEGNKIIIDLSPSQLKKLTNKENKVKLSSLTPGDEFLIGDEMFIVLEQTETATKIIAKNFTNKMQFGKNSDWKLSSIRSFLNHEFYDKIAAIVGEKDIILMERDLTSLDGLDDYGTCTDRVSLLTATEYAKYHKILGSKSNYPCWWWTITPASTPSNDYSRNICCVCYNGVLNWNLGDYDRGVRPFLTLNSAITVSKG